MGRRTTLEAQAMPSNDDRKERHSHDSVQWLRISPTSEMLTLSKQETPRRILRGANAYFQKVFSAKNPAKSPMQEMDNLCLNPFAVNHAEAL